MPRTRFWLLLISLLLVGCATSSTPSSAPTPTLGAFPLPSPSAAPQEDGAAPNATTAPLPTAATLAPNTHPRLWLTPPDVERYRSWATGDNPLWADGLALLAERARAEMDEGRVPDQDCGNIGYEEYPTEMYAELFAFLSLIGPDPEVRAADAARARTLLMHVMNAAAQGPATEEDFVCSETQQYPPFRHPDFFTSDRDRARYHGEAFALTVDWIYPILSAEDKATIRKVFLQWSEDIITRGYHHPEPVGMLNDPQLLADLQQVRFAGNNYYAAHMRNLGLMALALDESDDPDNALRGYLDNATGAYLYIFDHLIATDARGGLLPEGLEYSPQTASYVTQFLWAMQSAQVPHTVNREFWGDFITAYLHSLSPAPHLIDRDGERLNEYQPAWYGDAQDYRLPDFINTFGALGHLANDDRTLNALRWSAIHTAPGGSVELVARVRNPIGFRDALLYFMLLDPAAPEPTDPRPLLPVEYVAPGMNRLFSRTSWEADATWFNYRIGWNSIDHQMADGNHFEFYRQGEWLTKGRTGYANIAEGIASSEFYNTLAIANDRPVDRDDSDWRIDLWRRGSQWNLVAAGDPTLVAQSASPLFAYATGDATNLYNSPNEGSTDVLHASRSIVWLKPDHILVYDRAESKSEGQFKRWWLQLAQPATVTGQQAVATTPAGQQLFVTALLPIDAALKAVNSTESFVEETIANGEPMQVRLMSEAPGAPRLVQMLHVLQGADAGTEADPVTLVQSEDGRWEGASVGDMVVLFARTLGEELTDSLSYLAPAEASSHLVTGLAVNTGYDVTFERSGEGVRVTLQPGTQVQSDAGGVLTLAPPAP